MKGYNGEREEIERLETTEARRALGVMPQRDGSEQDNLKYIREKGEAWADKVRTSALTRMEAWVATKATIWKTIEFPQKSMCATRARTCTIASFIWPMICARIATLCATC